MALRYDQVADLIKIVDASACDELVLETADLKLVVRRKLNGDGVAHAPMPAVAPAPAAAPAATNGSAAAVPVAQPQPQAVAAPAGATEVCAPMVGTFYRAPAPDAPPFVEVGTVVSVGQPLCVIEVMKLFTTLFAETSGRVVEIAANDAEFVEYGRVLFVLEPV